MTSDQIVLVVIGVLILVAVLIAAFAHSSDSTGTQQRQQPPAAPPATPPQPHFRVRNRRLSNTQPATPMAQTAPPEYGPPIDLPQHIQIYHNQRLCLVCQSSIRRGYLNKGWARCRKGQRGKLVHGQCMEIFMASHPGRCPVCKTNCGITIIRAQH